VPQRSIIASVLLTLLVVVSLTWRMTPGVAERLRTNDRCERAEELLAAPPSTAVREFEPASVIESIPTLIEGSARSWHEDGSTNLTLEAASHNHGHISNVAPWRDALRRHSYIGGFTRSWFSGDLAADAVPADTVVMTGYQFDSNEDALSFHRWTNTRGCHAALEVFDIPEMDGAVGMRFAYGSGMVADQATWVAGDRRFFVGLNDVYGDPDREEFLAIVGPLWRYVEVTETNCAEAFHHLPETSITNPTPRSRYPAGPLQEAVLPADMGLKFFEQNRSIELDLLPTDRSVRVRRFERVWLSGEWLVFLAVEQYPTEDDAFVKLTHFLADRCHSVHDVYTEAALPGSVGISERVPGSVQETLKFQQANRIFTIYLGTPEARDSRDLVSEVSRALGAHLDVSP
jgi:hypothetical protein